MYSKESDSTNWRRGGRAQGKHTSPRNSVQWTAEHIDAHISETGGLSWRAIPQDYECPSANKDYKRGKMDASLSRYKSLGWKTRQTTQQA